MINMLEKRLFQAASSKMLDCPSPLLVFCKDAIKVNCDFIYTTACDVFGSVQPFFAGKVAPDENVFGAVRASSQWGVEVYNEVDLKLALAAKFNSIVADGYFKTVEFLEQCISNQVQSIHADSLEELATIDAISKSFNIKTVVGIRCKTDEHSKMGVSLKEAANSIPFLKRMKYISIEGVHTHPGSHSQGTEKAYSAYRYQAQMVRLLQNEGFPIKYVDIGGGVGELSEFGDVLMAHYKRIKTIFSQLTPCVIYVEPGRGVVGDAGALISHVVSIDREDQLVNVDIAVYPFFATTGATFKYSFLESKKCGSSDLSYSIGGIWPTTCDIIPTEKLYNKIPCDVKKGDRFVLYNAGAYTVDRLAEYSFVPVPIRFI